MESVAFSTTFQMVHAILEKEPLTFRPCTGRTFSFLNAMVYSLRILVDPILSICLAIRHLFQASYYLVSSNSFSLRNARIEVFRAFDYLLNGVCAPTFNLLLAAKCSSGVILPQLCYRAATEAEKDIIVQFHQYQKAMYSLTTRGVKDIKNYNIKTHIPQKITQLKQDSEKIRLAYQKMKLYTL